MFERLLKPIDLLAFCMIVMSRDAFEAADEFAECVNRSELALVNGFFSRNRRSRSAASENG